MLMLIISSYEVIFYRLRETVIKEIFLQAVRFVTICNQEILVF